LRSNVPKGQIDRYSHYGRNADNPSGAPHLDISGIQPKVGPFALKWPIKEGVNAFVNIGAQA
jgi:hypothetical protein